VIEDLYVAGMLRNRRLARHLADAAFGRIRRQLGYKTTWHGGRLVLADRFYPSSKMCSGCGAVKAKLRLSERMFRCELCGLILDRDLNAASNLAALVGGASSPSRGATINEPAGNPRKTRTAGTGYGHGKTIPESCKAIAEKYQQNTDPEFRARAIFIKEERSELVKHHLWVLWTDYFKPPHFEKYPQLHQLFNEATKLAGASGTKGSMDPAKGDELLAKIEEISKIFWETKQA
jgi:nickel superoxide dismutase